MNLSGIMVDLLSGSVGILLDDSFSLPIKIRTKVVGANLCVLIQFKQRAAPELPEKGSCLIRRDPLNERVRAGAEHIAAAALCCCSGKSA